jgi:hypothetical protein
MECAGRAKRRRRFGCCEALAQLKAPSPLRSAGALQMVVLTRSARCQEFHHHELDFLPWNSTVSGSVKAHRNTPQFPASALEQPPRYV